MTPDPPPDAATNPDAGLIAPPSRQQHRRRWSTLRLRSLMLVILIVGGALGWQARRASLQRRAVAAIKAAGGQVHYAHQCAEGQSLYSPSDAPPPGPAWLHRWIGDEYFQEVATVEFRDEGHVTAADLAAVAECPGLLRLDVGTVRDAGPGFRCLAGLRQLRELQINGPGLDDAMLGAIGKFSGLDRLVVRQGANLTDAGLGALQSLTHLTCLWIDDAPQITSRGVQPLIERNPELTNVSLTNTGIDDEALTTIGRLPCLAVLDVSQTRVGDRGLARLADTKTLTYLILDDTTIGDAGLAHLANLQELVTLDLIGTKITGAGLRHLARLPDLRVLRLEGTAVDDDGLRAIQPLTQTLDGLYLDGTRVTDAGVRHLTSLGELDWLSLRKTRITDASIPSLAAIPELTILDLSDTPTTAEGHATLLKARPKLSLFGEKPLADPKAEP